MSSAICVSSEVAANCRHSPKALNKRLIHYFSNLFKKSFNLLITLSYGNKSAKTVIKDTNGRHSPNISLNLAKSYFIFILVLFLFSLIPNINCDHNWSQNSTKNSNHGFKSRDSINYVDIKASEESSEEDFWSGLGHVKFVHAFIASVSVIIVSELGDKTFFIAAIMAMRHSRSTVFMAAMSAIFVMNTLAVLLGMATTVIPRFITHYGSIILFALFGLKMLHEGHSMSADEGKEEYEEVQKSLSKRETADLEYNMVSTSAEDPETGVIKTISSVSLTTRLRRKLMVYVSLVFIETFTMTFLAEWGDRSQISTIILAAREDVLGVSIGALCGHCICTGIAVLGGRIIAQMISVKTVTLIGGIVFIFFAIFALLMSE